MLRAAVKQLQEQVFSLTTALSARGADGGATPNAGGAGAAAASPSGFPPSGGGSGACGGALGGSCGGALSSCLEGAATPPLPIVSRSTATTDTDADAAALLAAASARLSGAAATLASLAASAALVPVRTMHIALSRDVERYAVLCGEWMARHKPMYETAVGKVRSVVSQLWPRAQVKVFGSYATGLMRPGSDVDLVVTLPKVRTTTAIPNAANLEGLLDTAKDTWQANLARSLIQQPWVVPESVRTIETALVPIVSFATRFFTEGGVAVRLDVSFEGPLHNGLATNELVSRALAGRPALKPLTLVLKQFLAERSLDKPYLGGLGSYGLLLLVTRFLQAQDAEDAEAAEAEGGGDGGGGEAEAAGRRSLGARLVALLDFYGTRFDPRNMGVSVTRNAGDGEYILRDHRRRGHPLRVDLSQLPAPQWDGVGWTAPQMQPGHPLGPAAGARRAQLTACSDWSDTSSISSTAGHGPASIAAASHTGPLLHAGMGLLHGGHCRPRPASEAGDWVPPHDPFGPAQANHRSLGALQRMGGGGATPQMLRTYSFRSSGGSVTSVTVIPEAAAADDMANQRHGRASWFDPLYTEDPLRPSNNVGRNCFRVYAIQQELAKARTLACRPRRARRPLPRALAHPGRAGRL